MSHISIEIGRPDTSKGVPSGFDPNLSVYLDLLRLLAAVAVVLYHSRVFIAPDLPDFVSGHGQEAVAIFFVLSGYVIAQVTRSKEATFQSYSLARFSRVFSVVPLALLSTWLVDKIGMSINPSHYAEAEFFNPSYWTALLRAVTFTNEIWTSHVVFGTDEPYWSLGFECIYYAVFALFLYAPRRAALALAGVALILAGPKVALAFPIWLIGVAAHRLTTSSSWTLGRASSIGVMIGTVFAYIIVRRVSGTEARAMFQWHGFYKQILTIAYYAAVGSLFAAHLIGFQAAFARVALWPTGLARSIRWLAGASFTLYLVHEPVIFALSAATLPGQRTPAVIASMFLGLTILTLLLAEIGERRKHVIKSWIGLMRSSLGHAFALVDRRAPKGKAADGNPDAYD